MHENVFTIVIPLYNKENHIKRCIQSILDQTYQNFEIIVINDGSTDNSLERLKTIRDNRIEIYSQKNKGVSSARNYGIKKSKNSLIAFLDADDTYEKDFLLLMNELINEFPNAGMYGSSYNFVKGASIVPCNHYYSFPKDWKGYLDDYFKFALKSPIITSSSVIVRKECFDKVGLFNETFKRGEDLDMWRRIALNYDVCYINVLLANYHKDSENMATKTSFNLTKYRVSMSEHDFIKNKGFSVYHDEYMLKAIYIKANYLIDNSQNKEARKLLWKYRKTKYNKKLFLKTFLKTFFKKHKK